MESSEGCRAQWAAFNDNQRRARKQLKSRAESPEGDVAIATVPIYFENHEDDQFNGRDIFPSSLRIFSPKTWTGTALRCSTST